MFVCTRIILISKNQYSVNLTEDYISGWSWISAQGYRTLSHAALVYLKVSADLDMFTVYWSA